MGKYKVSVIANDSGHIRVMDANNSRIMVASFYGPAAARNAARFCVAEEAIAALKKYGPHEHDIPVRPYPVCPAITEGSNLLCNCGFSEVAAILSAAEGCG